MKRLLKLKFNMDANDKGLEVVLTFFFKHGNFEYSMLQISLRKAGEAGFCSSTRNKEIWSMALNHSEWWIFNSWLCLPCVPFFPASSHNSLKSLTWIEVRKKGISPYKTTIFAKLHPGKPVTFRVSRLDWSILHVNGFDKSHTQLSVTVSTSMNRYTPVLL